MTCTVSKLDDCFPEGGSGAIIATFNGLPTTAYWKLTDSSGTVINSKSLETLSVSEDSDGEITGLIVLSGDDLAVPIRIDITRTVTVWGKYNSNTYGNNLDFVAQTEFDIEEAIGIE